MNITPVSRFNLIALTLVPFLAAGSAQAARQQDVLVVQARQRTVALALDVRAMRDMVMITYRGTASTGTPLMHVWSPSANAWQELAPEAYAVGQFMPSQPGTLFLIGSDVPASVIDGAAQAAKVVRIDSVSIPEIANTLNQHLNFSTREWKALAERHGMQTRDLNYEQRKWGRFGPPSSERPAPEKPAMPDEQMPQELTESLDAAASAPVVAELMKAARNDTEAPAPAVEPEAPAPIKLDAAAGAPLEPEAAVAPVVVTTPPLSPVSEEKGAVPQAALPTIDELRPEDK